MRIRIDVTQADIDAGKRNDCGKCPVALAARRALPGHFVTVTYTDMQIDGPISTCYRLPDSAERFVAHFDNDLPRDYENPFVNPVVPFSFEMDFLPRSIAHEVLV